MSRRRAGLVLLFSLAGQGLVAMPPALAGAVGSTALTIDVAKSTPESVLYGRDIPVEVTVANTSSVFGYNLSVMDVLPQGASYVGGTASVGDPTATYTLANGDVALVWSNVADIVGNGEFTLTYDIDLNQAGVPGDTFLVGSTVTDTASAFLNDVDLVREITDFAPNGGNTAIVFDPATYSATDADSADTFITAIEVEKAEPNEEGEILRGLQEHQTEYTITVTNNDLQPTHDIVVVDHIPAGLEFLACGDVNNTTDAPTNPGNVDEYLGSGDFAGAALTPDCYAPSEVLTVTDPAGLPAGVYTRVTWTLDDVLADANDVNDGSADDDLGASEVFVLKYRAAVPLRENTETWTTAGGAPAGTAAAFGDTPLQAGNLDNNSGPETQDEQLLVNHVRADGDYKGAFDPDGTNRVFDTFELERTSEDVSIHKCVDIETLEQGTTRRWGLVVETSEYRDAAAITFDDVLPDGLLVDAASVTWSTGAGEAGCAAVAQGTGGTWSNRVDNNDGTTTLSFDSAGIPPLGNLDATEYVRISFTSTTLAHYREDDGGLVADVPTSAADAVTNTIEKFFAPVTSIPDVANDDASDLGPAFAETVVDGSSAGLSAAQPMILKEVALDQASVAADCSDIVTWQVLPDVPTYRPGDRVCFRLSVDFPTTVHTKNPIVQDFLPPGVTLVPASVTTTGTATVDHTFPVVLDDTLDAFEFVLGDSVVVSGGNGVTDSTSLWVQPGQTFTAVFAVTADQIPSIASSADLTENLMKLRWENTAGAAFNLRDLVTYDLIQPNPQITKTVVNSASNPFEQGEVVNYSTEVENTGMLAALNVVIEDTLPSGIACGDVGNFEVGGVGAAPTCLAGVIMWASIASIGVGATSAAHTYDLTIPAGAGSGANLVNTAAVTTFESATNTGANEAYVADGGTNWPVTSDTAEFDVVSAGVTKDRTTSVDEAGNDADTEATIGETIAYAIVATVPANTDVYQAAFLDSLTDQVGPALTQQVWDGNDVTLTAVTSAGLTFFTSAETDCATLAAQPGGALAGFALCVTGSAPNQVVTLDFPDDYSSGAGDDTFALGFTTRVTKAATNVVGRAIDNTATLNWNIVDGGQPTSQSASIATTIVEPDLSLVKVSDDGDGILEPGQVVEYTVTVANGSGANVATAHDLSVTDVIPDGLLFTANTVVAGVTFGQSGQDLTWTFASIAPGDSVVLTYTATATTQPIAGASYINDADVVGTSLAGVDVNERVGDLVTPVSGYQDSDAVTLSVPSPTLTKTGSTSKAIGDVATFTVTATIPAGASMFDAVVTDTLPAGLSYIATDSQSCTAGCDASVAGDAITVTNSNVAAAASLSWSLSGTPGAEVADTNARTIVITYRAFVKDVVGNVAGTTLVNGAAITWKDSGLVAAGSVAAPTPATVTVIEPRVAIAKAVTPTTANPGDTLTYTITVTNPAGANVSTAYDIIVTDPIDDDNATDFTIGASTGATVTDSTAPGFAWKIDSLAPGGTATLRYTAKLAASSTITDADTVDNEATASDWTSFDTDAPPAGAGTARTYPDKSATAQANVAFPNVTYDKAVGAGSDAEVGASFAWVITLENDGDGPAKNVDVVDTLPLNWVFDSGSASYSVDSGAANAVVPSVATSAGVQTLTFTDIVATLAVDSTLVLTLTAKPLLAAQSTPGTGGTNAHTNRVVATAEDTSGATGNQDGAYARNADDDSTDPATADAFLPAPGQLGDHVWLDLDDDGVRDAGWETDFGGLAGITVSIAGPNGFTDSTTTGADGGYKFTGLPPGSYTVTVTSGDLPTGLVTTYDSDGTGTPHVSITTVAAGEDVTTENFGYRGALAIGDTVWLDLDNSQDKGPLEPGIEGVTVRLLDADGNLIATDVTNGSGIYGFTGLPAGTYDVEILTSSLPDGVTPTFDDDGHTVTPNVSTVVLTSTDDLAQDFGYKGDLRIGDRVYFDVDGAGDEDASDPGIEGVTVQLVDDDGDVVAETTTSNTGAYIFDNVPPGDWTVRIVTATLPDGAVQTVDNDGLSSADESTTTLVAAEDLDQDFGYKGDASLGDQVWLDENVDGINAGEDGFPSMVVNLYLEADAGTVIATTTTDGLGNYSFDELLPGSYVVEFVLPDGIAFTTQDNSAGDDDDSDADVDTGLTAPIAIVQGDDITDVDAGVVELGSIGDFVWDDLDTDGIQDIGEDGLDGITVNLYLAGDLGTVIATRTTVDGDYLFEDVYPGTYVVEVVLSDPDRIFSVQGEPGDAVNSDVDRTTGQSGSIVLGNGQDIDDIDAGTYLLASIGDTVFVDANADGTQAGSDRGLSGVVVHLYVADDLATPVRTTTTDSNGKYLFDGLDPALDFVVGIEIPSGWLLTRQDVGSDTTDSDIGASGRTIVIELDPAEEDMSWDAGVFQNGSLGDYVWIDLDNDGIQDADEVGLEGVTVRLYVGSATSSSRETVTGPDDAYLFSGLRPGTYRVEVVPPAGWVISPTGQGTAETGSDVDQTTGQTGLLTITSGLHRRDVDAGLTPLGSIAGEVWRDVDADGTRAGGDTPVSGVHVQLLMGGQVVAETVTGADGSYVFDDLLPGDYVVRIDAPDGQGFTLVDVGGDGVDSDVDRATGVSPVIVLAAGEDVTSVDAGLVGLSSIGDRVWLDLDRDGQQDAGEPGLQFVVVNLLVDGVVVETMLTGVDGAYLFDGLLPGNYVVEFTAPLGYKLTTPDVGADGLDSDAAANGRTAVIVLPQSTDVVTIDAGLVATGVVSGRIFEDLNDDGMEGADEPGVAGAIVEVLIDGQLIERVEVDADGSYVFVDLPPGEIVIRVILPDGLTLVGDGIGAENVDSDFLPETQETASQTLELGATLTDIDGGVRRRADLVLAKVLNGSLVAGAEATYRLTLTNHGPAATVGTLIIVDVLPVGLAYRSFEGAPWSCAADGQKVTCMTDAVLQDGDVLGLGLVVLVSATAGSGIANSATVLSTSFESTPDGASATTPSVLVRTTGGLPATGTNGANLLLLGLFAVLSGALVLRRQRRRGAIAFAHMGA